MSDANNHQADFLWAPPPVPEPSRPQRSQRRAGLAGGMRSRKPPVKKVDPLKLRVCELAISGAPPDRIAARIGKSVDWVLAAVGEAAQARQLPAHVQAAIDSQRMQLVHAIAAVTIGVDPERPFESIEELPLRSAEEAAHIAPLLKAMIEASKRNGEIQGYGATRIETKSRIDVSVSVTISNIVHRSLCEVAARFPGEEAQAIIDAVAEEISLQLEAEETA